MNREFVGKSMLLNSAGEKVLVISDLHLGYDQVLRETGVFIPGKGAFKQTMTDLEDIFDKIKKVDKVILLGDVKHAIGTILNEEWKEVLSMFEYLKDRCKEIIFVKGNHDVFLGVIAERYGVTIVDYLIWKSYAFLHGDRDFDGLHGKDILGWVIGHVHPTVELNEGIKYEKYKCFLVGKYNGKEIVVMPSFFPVVEGSGLEDVKSQLVWDFNLRSFEIYAIGEGVEVYNFGRVKDLINSQN